MLKPRWEEREWEDPTWEAWMGDSFWLAEQCHMIWSFHTCPPTSSQRVLQHRVLPWAFSPRSRLPMSLHLVHPLRPLTRPPMSIHLCLQHPPQLCPPTLTYILCFWLGGLDGRTPEAQWEDTSSHLSRMTASDRLRWGPMTLRWKDRREDAHPPTRSLVSSHISLHSLLLNVWQCEMRYRYNILSLLIAIARLNNQMCQKLWRSFWKYTVKSSTSFVFCKRLLEYNIHVFFHSELRSLLE